MGKYEENQFENWHLSTFTICFDHGNELQAIICQYIKKDDEFPSWLQHEEHCCLRSWTHHLLKSEWQLRVVSIYLDTKDQNPFQYAVALTGRNATASPLETTFHAALESREKALKTLEVNHSSLYTNPFCSAVQRSHSQLLRHATRGTTFIFFVWKWWMTRHTDSMSCKSSRYQEEQAFPLPFMLCWTIL